MPLSYESILAFKNSLFIFKLKGLGDAMHDGGEAKPVHLKGTIDRRVPNGREHLVMRERNVHQTLAAIEGTTQAKRDRAMKRRRHNHLRLR